MIIDFEDAVTHVRSKIPKTPTMAVVLGSGLGGAVPDLKSIVDIPYAEIPDFPKEKTGQQSQIEGHKGILRYGELDNGVAVAILMGRVHYYEGFSIQDVIFPIRLLKRLGVTSLIITNAAGGIDSTLHPGSCMMITDHLNLMGTNPLIGPNDESFGVRFPDMGQCYSPQLQILAKDAAETIGIVLQHGVYAAVSGPSYETPAEIRMLKTLGADAIGMSTVPEVVAARHAAMQVLGISMISNTAAGIVPGHVLSHHEVIESGQKATVKLKDLLTEILKQLAQMH